MTKLSILILVFLAGCSTLKGKLENRVSCTVGKDKAFVVSEYGPLGVASTIAEIDRQAICK